MTWDKNYLARETWRQQVGENSARMAFAWGTSTTQGQGGVAHPEVIDFGLAFAEKPMFSYGFELLNRTDFEADNDTDVDPPIPTSTGCVYQWKVDPRGMYIGAHVAVYVVSDDAIKIEHHFGFVGLAIKDLTSGTNLTT